MDRWLRQFILYIASIATLASAMGYHRHSMASKAIRSAHEATIIVREFMRSGSLHASWSI